MSDLSTPPDTSGFAGATVLSKAREKLGTAYGTSDGQLDCSHFVHAVYQESGYAYDYRNTSAFVDKSPGSNGLATAAGGKFREITRTEVAAGDVMLFTGHMGIWDPDGCSALVSSNATASVKKECQIDTGKNVKTAADRSFLSARSSVGVNYGKTDWWKGTYRVFRWNDASAQTAK